MKTRFAIAFIAAALAGIVLSCDDGTSDDIANGSLLADSTADPTSYAVSVDNADTDWATDDLSSYSFTTVGIDLSAGTWDSLPDGVTISSDSTGLSITSTSADSIAYSLSGSLSGTVTVTSAADFQVVLNGAAISSSTGPALYLPSTTRAFITTAAGTSNSLENSAGKAALYSAGVLVIGGSGTLEVNGYSKHGILAEDYIRFAGGTVNVNVTKKNAVQAVNAVIIDDVALTITATGTTLDDESKGIKVEGDDDSTDGSGAGMGYIVINGGTISITSVSKGITAAWDVDEDLGDYEGGNPDPDVTINSGYITITTTGTPYETTDSSGATISLSPEGIEAKSDLVINSGYIVVETSDDCLNAGDSITINGGYFYCSSSSNDAIDSNGTMTITGGVVVALGSDAPESGFDCDEETFAITGGVLLGMGGSTSKPTAADCTQSVIVLYGYGSSLADKTFAICDSSGQAVFAADLGSVADAIVVSSPDLATGASYTVYAGATTTADEEFYGLALDGLTCSGGSSVVTVTTSSTVTTSGTAAGPNGR